MCEKMWRKTLRELNPHRKAGSPKEEHCPPNEPGGGFHKARVLPTAVAFLTSKTSICIKENKKVELDDLKVSLKPQQQSPPQRENQIKTDGVSYISRGAQAHPTHDCASFLFYRYRNQTKHQQERQFFCKQLLCAATTTLTILAKSSPSIGDILRKSQALKKVLCNYRVILKKSNLIAISVIIIYL